MPCPRDTKTNLKDGRKGRRKTKPHNLAKPQNHDGCRDIGPTLEPEWLRTLRLLLVLLLLLLLLLVLLFVFYCRVLNEVPHMGYSTGLPA